MSTNIHGAATYHQSKHLDMLNKNPKGHAQGVLELEGTKESKDLIKLTYKVISVECLT